MPPHFLMQIMTEMLAIQVGFHLAYRKEAAFHFLELTKIHPILHIFPFEDTA